jgi:hypothetical protein
MCPGLAGKKCSSLSQIRVVFNTAILLENDLDFSGIIERQLEQELEQDLNKWANALSLVSRVP